MGFSQKLMFCGILRLGMFDACKIICLEELLLLDGSYSTREGLIEVFVRGMEIYD